MVSLSGEHAGASGEESLGMKQLTRLIPFNASSDATLSFSVGKKWQIS